MMSSGKRHHWLVGAALAVACSPLLATEPPASAGELGEQLDAIRQRNGVAAFGLVLVKKDGVMLLKTRGLADRESKIPIRDDAIFRIGSVTKMFTGLAALQLQAAGKLELSEDLSRWKVAGTYTNPWRETDPITVAQLLEHSAGFTDISQPEWDYSDPRQLPLATTLRMYPEARTARWRPGLHHSYSNAGPGLAGYILEQASGKSYETLLEEQVFEPLGMADTSVLPPPAQRLPVGYDTDAVTPIPYWHQIFRPFAAINSTLADMGRFVRVLLGRGQLDDRQLYKPDIIARLKQPTTTLGARAGLEFGYGLGVYSWERHGVLFYGHGGDADGYLSRLGYTRSNGSGYYLVITAFQQRTLRRMQAMVEDFLIRGVEGDPEPTALPLDETERATLPGRYERSTYRFRPAALSQRMQVTLRDGALYTRIDDSKEQALIKVRQNLFRRPGQRRATVFLGEGDDKVVYFQEDEDNFRKLVP